MPNLNPKALFIGPFGENQEEFRHWVNFLIEDISNWRRNFHPYDPRLINPSEKREENYLYSVDKVQEVLDRILAEMKQSLPYHSPRYFGHMLSVLSIPAVLGYFAGILYNQNNVVGEVSPISTRLELEFMKELCSMLNYPELSIKYEDKPASWGHLTSGGSTAILESLWTARNIKYYPISVKLFDIELQGKSKDYLSGVEVSLANGTKKSISDSSFFELFNITTGSVMELRENITVLIDQNVSIKDELTKGVERFLIQDLGVHQLHQLVFEANKEVLKIPKVYVSQTSHYSWKKNMDILGFGKNSVELIPSDTNFHIDLAKLKKCLKENDSPILMVVGICGTTEEGAIDPIDKIVEIREKLETENNKSFYLMVDAAWGGYYCSMLTNDIPMGYSIFDKLRAIKEVDAVVIDPHKMGYIPYAVGSICYKDTRYKDFIYKEAPYLAVSKSETSPLETSYLGGWTIEGSRSGAAAVACAMSTRVIPLNSEGHGKIIKQSIEQCKLFYERVIKYNENPENDFKIIPTFIPESNVLCYNIISPEYITDARHLNNFTNAIYNSMSAHPKKPISGYEFFVSKTDLAYSNYKDVLDNVVKPITIADQDFKLSLLRSVFMNPNIIDYDVTVWEENEHRQKHIFDAFIEELVSVANKTLPEIMLSILSEQKKGERVNILWIENKESFQTHQSDLLLDKIQSIPEIGKFMDITFYNFTSEIKGKVGIGAIEELTLNKKKFDFSIIDLNLADNDHIEWASGFSVIDFLYQDRKIKNMGIPIIYSKFFDNDNTKNALHSFFSRYNNLFFNPELQFLGKQTIEGQDNEAKDEANSLLTMVKSIFKLLQEKQTLK